MTGRLDPAESASSLADILGIGLFAKTFDRALIDSVLQETGRREQRVRLLPAHLVVHLVLGLALHADKSYAEVADRLAHGLQHITGSRGALALPSGGAITAARTRLGSAPLKALFNRAALPLASPASPRSFLGDLLVVEAYGAILNVADSPANAQAFGYGHSPDTTTRSALPQVSVITLTEAGTRATIGAALGSAGVQIRELAASMSMDYLRPGMLLTAGGDLLSAAMWRAARATGADLLWPVADSLALPVHTALPDGTYLSSCAQPVRVLTCVGADAAQFRLITSLLLPSEAPAEQLLAVFARRADASQAFARFNTPAARPLRSRKPDLVRQEIWAHLLSDYALRAFINLAADGIRDPDDGLPNCEIFLVRHPAADAIKSAP